MSALFVLERTQLCVRFASILPAAATIPPAARYNSANQSTPIIQVRSYGNTLCASILLVASLTTATAQRPRANTSATAIPANILLRIIRAEDERRWDLGYLLADSNAAVRKRAALAMGRIGDEKAMPFLLEVLKTEPNNDVRQMIALAIG